MADDLRQRYAEAIAAKFTYPDYRSDRDGENERVENAEPADRIGTRTRHRADVVTLLDGDGDDPPPGVPESHADGSTRCVCKRTLTDPVSLAYGIGPDCRKRLGIVPRRPVRVTGVEMWRDCEGQTDLLETPDDE